MGVMARVGKALGMPAATIAPYEATFTALTGEPLFASCPFDDCCCALSCHVLAAQCM